jgi:hypothetical protein
LLLARRLNASFESSVDSDARGEHRKAVSVGVMSSVVVKAMISGLLLAGAIAQGCSGSDPTFDTGGASGSAGADAAAGGTSGIGGSAGAGATGGLGGTGAAGGGGTSGSGGDAGDAGIDAEPPKPGTPGVAVLTGGTLIKSTSYSIIATVGEGPGGNAVISSPNYKVHTGIIGTTQP